MSKSELSSKLTLESTARILSSQVLNTGFISNKEASHPHRLNIKNKQILSFL